MNIRFRGKDYEVRSKWVVLAIAGIFCLILYVLRSPGKAADRGSFMISDADSEVTSVPVAGINVTPRVPQDGGAAGDAGNKGKIRVYILGQVKHPGVYKLDEGSLIVDAVRMAGGFKSDAYKNFNLAWKLKNGCMITIPKRSNYKKITICRDGLGDAFGRKSSVKASGKKKSGAKGGKSRMKTSKGDKIGSGKININTAGAERLTELNGIGEVLAGRIMEYREQIRFQTPEDIKNVSGIGDFTYEKIKDRICVD